MSIIRDQQEGEMETYFALRRFKTYLFGDEHEFPSKAWIRTKFIFSHGVQSLLSYYLVSGKAKLLMIRCLEMYLLRIAPCKQLVPAASRRSLYSLMFPRVGAKFYERCISTTEAFST